METPPAEEVDEQGLGAALRRSWAIAAARLRFVPKGFGSYHWVAEEADGTRHFVAVDDLDVKPWLGSDRQSTFEGLRSAFEVALVLGGVLPFVVAPRPTCDGESAARLTDRYSIAVFPYIDGVALTWGTSISRAERDRLLGLLAELHGQTATAAAHATVRPPGVVGLTVLSDALESLDRPWEGGPLSEPARQAVAAHADALVEQLASVEVLRAAVAGGGARAVVTHGEPHPGNLIRAEGGLRLVDWDTAALALPERDLWMLDDATAGALDAYGQVAGRDVDTEALRLYRRAWALEDVAAFVSQLRSPHDRNGAAEKALRMLASTLDGTAPPPYGPFTAS